MKFLCFSFWEYIFLNKLNLATTSFFFLKHTVFMFSYRIQNNIFQQLIHRKFLKCFFFSFIFYFPACLLFIFSLLYFFFMYPSRSNLCFFKLKIIRVDLPSIRFSLFFCWSVHIFPRNTNSRTQIQRF